MTNITYMILQWVSSEIVALKNGKQFGQNNGLKYLPLSDKILMKILSFNRI